jgi:hypothetical protein
MFENGPLTRKCPGECGSVLICTFIASSRTFSRQICAHDRKKRCSGVKPSIFSAFLSLSERCSAP